MDSLIYNVTIYVYTLKINMPKWLSSKKTDAVIRVQILDEAVRISYSDYNVEKGMNTTILHPAMRKIGLFNLGMATDLGERNLWIQNSA